jgi:hypothetical protein
MSLYLVILIAIGLIAAFICEWHTHRSLGPSAYFERLKNDRAVSGEEFLAACGTRNPQLAFKIRAMIAEQCDVPAEYIHPHDRLVEDLRM